MRKKVIAGNWKMNMLPNEAIEYIQAFESLVKDAEAEVILCVPYTDLFYCLMNAQGTNIKIGAQNMHFAETGAYTGEVSAKMLKSIGVEYVIIGHSERRAYYGETDETVNKKLKAAFENELKPIVCVGESLEEREAGKTEEIITSQTRLALEGLTNEQVKATIIAYEPIWAIGTGKTATSEDANNSIKSIREEIITNQTRLALEGLSNEQVKATIIAYEPIWAIGTGKTATSEDANNSIKSIRAEIRKIYGEEVAENVIIQYGGSVKSSNAKELFSTSDIDGGLVGGASLKPDEFSKIVNYDK